MKRTCTSAFVAAVAILLTESQATFAGPLYTVTDLGKISPGGQTFGLGLNNRGEVVGYGGVDNGAGNHAFLYRGGVIHDLGTLGGKFSEALGINDNGQITGISYLSNPGSAVFLYSGGIMQNLGTLPYGPVGAASGNAINNNGVIVGSSYTYAPQVGAANRAFIYSNGVMTDLGALPGRGNSEALAINSIGQVTGDSDSSFADVTQHAFLFSAGVMQDLGTLPGWPASRGFGINDGGDVVGSAYTASGINEAFLYSGGAMHDLGNLGAVGSIAYGINNQGRVIGELDFSNAVPHAFVYDAGIMTDLNSLISPSSGWELWSGHAINNLGQIAGYGVHSYTLNGQLHRDADAFLLTPVPEPSPQFLLTLGTLLLAGRLVANQGRWRSR